ncbi:MAG: glycosyltransferase family 4 protein [Candidatus Moranbacteria bacterium]|nr:glycosyltransferase family 4 protein [Candidatus Moranbacteria bacterium]
MNQKIRLFLKKSYLCLNDKTIKTRFFFDGEYARWEKFNADRKTTASFIEKNAKEQKIFYLVPGVKISGGIAVVFQHANGLLQRGYDVKILSLNNSNDGSWFPNQEVEILPYSQTQEILESDEADVLIATAYSTAFSVDMSKAKRKLYFVQSDESRFFPEDAELTKKIKKTYELPLEYVVAVSWLQEWLKKEFGQDAHCVPNGLDLNMFHKTEAIEPKANKIRILIEGGINISYKGMDDAYAVVKDLDCELWIVSNNGKPRRDWKYDRFFENVSLQDMPKIYSSCDILLKMSKVESFCYPPLEMMACGGVAVIRRVTGIEEYAVDGENCLIVEDIESAKKAIERLISDESLRNKLITTGLETTKKWDWNNSIDLLEKSIIKH